jgi:hypothetical protein
MEMGSRAVQAWLFALFLLTVPVANYMAELEIAPVVRPAFIVLLGGIVLVDSGSFGLSGLISLLGAVQVLVWGTALFFVARLGAGLVCRWVSADRRLWVVGAVAVGLVGVGLTPIYDTPLSSLTPYSSLLEIFR